MKTNNMVGILYFSSTGNSLYIAKRAQSRTGGSIKYIPNYNGDGSEFEKIVLVTPIYSFGMPTFVYDIIPRLNKQSAIFIIQNYGGMIASGNGVQTHFCGNKSVFAVLNSLIVLLVQFRSFALQKRMPLSGDFFSAKTLRAEKSVFSEDFLRARTKLCFTHCKRAVGEKG